MWKKKDRNFPLFSQSAIFPRIMFARPRREISREHALTDEASCSWNFDNSQKTDRLPISWNTWFARLFIGTDRGFLVTGKKKDAVVRLIKNSDYRRNATRFIIIVASRSRIIFDRENDRAPDDIISTKNRLIAGQIGRWRRKRRKHGARRGKKNRCTEFHVAMHSGLRKLAINYRLTIRSRRIRTRVFSYLRCCHGAPRIPHRESFSYFAN